MEVSLLKLNQIRKEKIITINSYGAVLKKGIGVDTAVNEKRVIAFATRF